MGTRLLMTSTGHWQYYCIVIIIFYQLTPDVEGSKYQRRLLDHIFDAYDTRIRPVMDDSETVVVQIKQTIQHIMDIDEHDELFMTSGWSSLKWNDTQLKWNPEHYNGIRLINLPPNMIWIPDI